MMIYIYMFIAHFLYVFLKAFQQRNVAFDHYKMIVPISYGMALMEVFVIASIATRGFTVLSVVALGTAGGLGALLAMWSHKKILT